MDKKLILTTALCVASAGAGAAAGWFVAKKQLKKQYEDLAKQEIAEAKEFYRVLHKKDEFETPEKAAAVLVPAEKSDNEFTEAATAMKTYQGDLEENTGPNLDAVVRETVVTQIHKNVFERYERPGETDAAWERELRDRTEDAPYVLKQPEYMECELDYEQVTVTYYRGDDTLVDDREDVIEEPDELVGLYNLKRFGHWSGDPRVVYVRNHVKELDIEIILHEGKYGEIVAGEVG